MEIVGILATTHLDRHGERIVQSALRSFVESINGSAAIPLSLEHETTLPPLGKILHAALEPTEDGEYQVVGTMEVFDDPKPIQLPDGTALLEASSRKDRRPFVGGPKRAQETIEVAYDQSNFQSNDHVSEFLQVIADQTVTPRRLVRKAWIPNPELVITMSTAVVSSLAAKKVMDKVVDKLGDLVAEDVANFYGFVKKAVVHFAGYAIPKNRPITYVFRAPGDPVVEFVVRSNDPNIVIQAIRMEDLVELFRRADELSRSVNAVKLQFLLGEDRKWALNYLLTKEGKVIGSSASFSNRAKYLEILRSGALSVDASLGDGTS